MDATSDPGETPAPTTPPPPTTPPSGTPMPPGGGAIPQTGGAGGSGAQPPYVAPPPSGGGSRKGLWIALSVVGVILVLIVVAVVAVAVFGDSDGPTEVVEENLPAELEANFAAQGIEVDVTDVRCDEISSDEGPFTVGCRIAIAGLDQRLDAEITGSISGTTVSVTDARSESNVLNEALAVQAAQPLIDGVASGVLVQACDLGAPLVVVEDGLQFTCTTDSAESVTFEVQDNQLDIIDVQPA